MKKLVTGESFEHFENFPPGVASSLKTVDLVTVLNARSDFSLPLLSVTDSTVVSDSESEDQFHTLHNVRSITNSDRDEFHTLKDVNTLTAGDDSSEDEFHTLANVKDLSPDKQASISHSSKILVVKKSIIGI